MGTSTPRSCRHSLLAYVENERLGVATAGGVYMFPGAETGLIPDVCFYTAERDAPAPDKGKPNPLRARRCYRGRLPLSTRGRHGREGPRVPARRGAPCAGGLNIDLWRAGVRTSPMRTLGLSETLDGEDVVADFSYAVSALFTNPLRQAPRAEPPEPA